MIDDDKPSEDSSELPDTAERVSEDMSEDAQIYDAPQALPDTKHKKGVGFSTVLFMSALAAIFGAIGGGVISHFAAPFLGKPDAPVLQADVKKTLQTTQDLEARLSALEAKPMAEQSDLIKALDARLAALEARPTLTETGEAVDPNIMERLEALEGVKATDPVDVSELDARLKALEALAGSTQDEADTLALDPAILDRLMALENQEPAQVEIDPEFLNRLTELENQELPDIPEPVDLSPILERLEALESRTESVRADLNAALAARQSLPLPPFPREKVVAAISSVTEAEKGWFERTINKHVQIRDDSLVLIVDDIEALLLQGEIDRALKRIEDLPQEGREAAQPWVDEVKIQRTSL